MPTPVYQCDLCQTVFPTLQEAQECEGEGVPEHPAWLKKGATVYGFGENGVVGPGIVDTLLVEKSDWGKHALYVWVDISGYDLSHNYRSDEPIPQWALDPMRGWDFLRYVEHKNFPEQLKLWIDACETLGIEPDHTQAQWFDPQFDKGKAIQAAMAELR